VEDSPVKLLSPKDQKSQKEAEVQRDILRAQDAQDALRDARLELSRSQADFSKTLAENRDRWSREEQEHEARKKEIEDETADLLAKRAEALVPLDEMKLQLDERESKLNVRGQEISQLEVDNAERMELLEDKLDLAGKQLKDLEAREVKLALQESGSALQAESTRAGTKRLNQRIQQLVEDKLASIAWLKDEREKIETEKWAIENRKLSLDRTDTALAELGIRLADERKTLDAAWSELKAKKA
jgi:hypothetical protein